MIKECRGMSEYRDKAITVAIVEDDPMVSRVTKGFLAKVAGYVCQATYTTVQEAINGIQKNQPDLILLDLFFLKKSGMDVLKWIRESELDVDVILITADHTTSSIERAMRYGAVDYLVKPFHFDRFEQALQKYQQMKEKLADVKITDQSKIDALINGEQPTETEKTSETEKTDTVREERNMTYQTILDHMREHADESFTAKMVSAALGIARITARRYLDQMERDDTVKLNMVYGSIGRPQNYYQYKGDVNEH
jgi:two-component system CitB family response regulator